MLPSGTGFVQLSISPGQYLTKTYLSVGAWRSGSAPALGAGGREFESRLPDQTDSIHVPSRVLGLSSVG